MAIEFVKNVQLYAVLFTYIRLIYENCMKWNRF